MRRHTRPSARPGTRYRRGLMGIEALHHPLLVTELVPGYIEARAFGVMEA